MAGDKDTGAWRDGSPSFHRVIAWGQLAENVAESMHKGAAVLVVGEQRQRSYEQDGDKRTVWGHRG